MKIFLLPLCALLVAPALGAAEKDAAPLTEKEAQNFKAAADYSKAARGVAVLVMRDGEIVFEDYAPIWSAEKPHLLAAGTISFCGVLAACAAYDGLLELDEKVSDTLSEWKDGGHKAQMTIRQLLNLTSGLEGGAESPNATFRRAVELATAAEAPGKVFSYGPLPFQCFGELLRRKLAPRNEAVYDYLDRRVLAPIGLRVGYWRRDSETNANLSSGAFLTAREWAKFGELVRMKGAWRGREIIPAALLDECMKPSTVQPAYGLGWWLLGLDDECSHALSDGGNKERQRRAQEERRQFGFPAPRDTFAAMGRGKQRCYIIPSLEMVIVRMGDSENREFSDIQFLARLFGKRKE